MQDALGAVAFVTEPSATMLYLSNVDWKLSERAFLLVVLANESHFFVVPGARPRKMVAALAGVTRQKRLTDVAGFCLW